MNNRQIAKLTCLIGFMDLLAVSMILPLVATRAKELGASSFIVGFIGSIYGAVQLFSSPVIGSWSDVTGRKFVLIVTLVAAAFGYFLMGCSSLLAILIFSRFLLGLFKHSQSISNTYLSSLIPHEERGVYYGYFTASSSVGFIVGPTCGGHLAELPNGFFWVAFVASVIFILNAVIVWIFLPDLENSKSHAETLRSTHTVSNNTTVQDDSLGLFKRYIHQFQLATCWDVMVLRLILGFSTLVYRSSFSLILLEKFEFSPKYVGYLTSYQGAVSTVAGFLVGHLTRIDKNENRQAFFGALSLFLALFGLTVLPSISFLVVSLTILCISTSFLRVCLNKVLASRSSKDKMGAIFGLGQSMTSVARMLAPLAGGMALEMGAHGPGLVGTITSGFGLIITSCLFIQSLSKEKIKVQ